MKISARSTGRPSGGRPPRRTGVTIAASALAAILAVVVGSTGSAAAATASPGGAADTISAAASGQTQVADVCGTALPHRAHCFAQVRADVHGGLGVRGPAAGNQAATTAALPDGLSPQDLHAAYRLPWTGGANQTVAIVDAGDDATAEADLSVYRATYGLPACTTENGCFRKVNQRGAASPLPANQGWNVEIALDLDMVSAACADCRILLVEGDTSLDADLAASVDTAVALGATEVSNSYGEDESPAMLPLQASYSHPGVAILASSGDAGYGIPSWPAVQDSVISVGGTSLTKASNSRGWNETAWRGAGAGLSAWVAKTAWQHDKHCPGRMIADVSADADPRTGPAVYDSSASGLHGWGIVGGTSASSPFLAGVIALAGNPQRYPNASFFYSHTGGLHDVVGGNDVVAIDCGGDYQCNAVKGYDGPTGLGTPRGLSSF